MTSRDGRRRFYLLAVDALLGKLLLVAGQAVVVGVLLHEAPGANGLLAALAGETVLVPTVALVLHLFRAWWAEKADAGGEKSQHFLFSKYTQTLIDLNLV